MMIVAPNLIGGQPYRALSLSLLSVYIALTDLQEKVKARLRESCLLGPSYDLGRVQFGLDCVSSPPPLQGKPGRRITQPSAPNFS